MSRTVLLVGPARAASCSRATRARDWEVRGPFCEGLAGLPRRPRPDSGAIYAAAASEWHGASVWRSPDLGETWKQSSEGLDYAETGLKLSKVSGLTPATAGCSRAPRARHVREPRRRRDLVAPDDARGQPGSEAWNDPANQPPGHLGVPAIMPHPDEPEHYWAIVQGFGVFETTDDGATWTPRNRGLRADWPREYDDVGFCVHKLVMSPTDRDRMYQQNHVGMHRATTAGGPGPRSPRGCRREFGFAAAVHPHDRDTFYVIPLDPGHGRSMPDGGRRSGGRATPARPGSGSTTACRRRTPTSACSARGWRSTPRRARPLLRDQHRPAVRERRRGRTWSEIASYLPGISSVEVAVVD